MTPRPSVSVRILGTLALVASLAAPATAHAQRHAPAGSGAPPATAAPRSAPPPSPSPAPAPAPRSSGHDSGADRVQDRGTSRNGDNGDRSQADNGGGSSASGRRRGNLPATGDAVARTSPRPPQGGGGGGTIVYPWWYGGGYYGGYFAYDPWLGWYPGSGYDPVPSGSSVDDDGGLKLKVKPVEASVYVDGYYVGIVDEFDGVFQRLQLVSGPHRVDISAPDYETLSFDVMIQPNQTVTYRGDLVRQTH